MARAGEVDADTRLGGVYVGSLLREQLWLALRTLAVLVLTLGLVRATFSMRINADAHLSPEREAPTGGHALPGVELLKAVTEAFGTVLKGLPKR